MIILISLLSFVLSALWVTYQHEWCHAYVGKQLGFTDTRIFPFWHWASPKTGEYQFWRPWLLFKKPFPDARFYFARYTSYGNYPKEHSHILHIAPLYGDLAGMVVCSAIVLITALIAGVILFPFLILKGCYLVDSLVWWYGYFFGGPHTDGKKYKYGITGMK